MVSPPGYNLRHRVALNGSGATAQSENSQVKSSTFTDSLNTVLVHLFLGTAPPNVAHYTTTSGTVSMNMDNSTLYGISTSCML